MMHNKIMFQPGTTTPPHGYLCMLGMNYVQPCKLTCNAGAHHRRHAPPQNRPHCASSVILAPSSDVAGLHDSAAHKPSSCRPPQQSQSLRPGYTKCTVCRGAHCTKAVAPSLYREAANAPTTSASTSSAGMKADAPRPISCSTHPALTRAYACIPEASAAGRPGHIASTSSSQRACQSQTDCLPTRQSGYGRTSNLSLSQKS